MPIDENIAADSSSAEQTETVDAAAQAETTEQSPSEESTPSTDPQSDTEQSVETAPASDAGKPKGSDAEKRIKQLLAENKRLKQQGAPPVQPRQEPKLEEPKEPVLAEYNDYSKYETDHRKYIREFADFTAKKAIQDDRAQQHQLRQQAEVEQQNATLAKTWNKRVEDTTKRNPDFDVSAAVQAIQPNSTTDAFLLDSEVGPDLVLHLSQNPDEAEQLREMTPFQAVRKLIALEAQLKDQIKGIQPKVLPKPPNYVHGGAAPVQQKSMADVFYK